MSQLELVPDHVSAQVPALEVRDLCVTYQTKSAAHAVISDVSFDLAPFRTLALVGESGSGKTTVARAIMGLIRPPAGVVTGTVAFQGQDLLAMSHRDASDRHGRDIAMIFQEPRRSLNPAYSVGDQIAEVLRRHAGLSRRAAWARAVEVMEQVRIPRARERARSYPFEFSGGMCQRIMIAMAIACRPAVLIADEPTTALDVTVQAQVLDLMKEQQDELGLAMLFITHDLGVVADVADETMVMYAGQVVEQGESAELFSEPRHPYTEGLLGSVPSLSDDVGALRFIPGRVPSANAWPAGCRFGERCRYAQERCGEPIAIDVVGTRHVRCIRADELGLDGIADG